jgi:hypothetical protein
VCAFHHWTLADILACYRLTEAEGLKRLLHLDRLRLISLLPGNRILVTEARDFDWLQHGPIEQFFRDQGQNDFLDSAFAGEGETMTFAHGMLTASAMAQVQAELRTLKKKFAELHEESLAAPLNQRRGSGLLVPLREWELASFEKLRHVRADLNRASGNR